MIKNEKQKKQNAMFETRNNNFIFMNQNLKR